MTMTEIRRSDKTFLTPADVAEVLGSDAQAIRVQAGRDPRALGFPVMRIGSRTKIPREGFLRWMEGRI